MNPELPDLERQSDVDRTAMRLADFFRAILFALMVLTPWLFFIMSMVTGRNQWLTTLNLVGMHAGFTVALLGLRRGQSRMVRVGILGAVIVLLLCFVVLTMKS